MRKPVSKGFSFEAEKIKGNSGELLQATDLLLPSVLSLSFRFFFFYQSTLRQTKV